MSTLNFNTIMCFKVCFQSFFNMLIANRCIVIFNNKDMLLNLKSFAAFSKMWVPAAHTEQELSNDVQQ